MYFTPILVKRTEIKKKRPKENSKKIFLDEVI